MDPERQWSIDFLFDFHNITLLFELVIEMTLRELIRIYSFSFVVFCYFFLFVDLK